MLNRLKIRQQILIVFLSVAFSGSLLQLMVAGIQVQNATLDSYRQQLEITALSLASSLSEPFEDYVEHRNVEVIRAIVNRIRRDDSYEFLLLDARRSFILVDNTDIVPTVLPQSADDLTHADILVDQAGNERLYTSTSIVYERNILGYVMASIPMSLINQEISQHWAELTMATLPILILVVMASILLANTISNPLQRLEKGALKMAEGELDTRISIQSGDEIGQLAQAFNYMAAQIEDLLKVQQSFVSNAAHELRTPLMSLSLRIEALQGNQLDEAEQVEYLHDVRQEIQHMKDLVTGLLNLARIDERRIQNGSPIVDLSATLKDIARHWRIAAQKEALTFNASIPNHLPPIDMSQNYLRLICDNLLANAVKYTRQGTIDFTVSVDQNHLQLRIEDTGIGFTEDQTEHLFDRFYRTDIARANFNGTGLGLSIIDSLLDYFGGTVSAHSDGMDQGSTFIVSIPITKS